MGMTLTELMKMDLQMFADPGEGTDNPGEVNDEGTNDQGTDNLGEGGADETKGQENEQPEPKYTDEEVNEIINEKFAKWQRKQEEERKEAEKLAQMDAEERHEHEKKKLQEKLEEYERQENLREMSKTAKSMLEQNEIQATDEVLRFLVTEEADKTSENVKAFSALVEGMREDIRQDMERKMGTRTPLDGNGAPKKSIGEQLAEQANKQQQADADFDPWKV